MPKALTEALCLDFIISLNGLRSGSVSVCGTITSITTDYCLFLRIYHSGNNTSGQTDTSVKGTNTIASKNTRRHISTDSVTRTLQ